MARQIFVMAPDEKFYPIGGFYRSGCTGVQILHAIMVYAYFTHPCFFTHFATSFAKMTNPSLSG